MANKETISKAPARRAHRAPLGARNVLTIQGKDPEFVYRIVNDTGDRIAQLQAQGYVIEDSDAVVIGDKRVGKPSQVGTSATVQVGQGITGVVMKQRKDWYDEDQAAKAAQIKAQEDVTKQAPNQDGNYGKIDFIRS
jgi:hypothetical protein